MKGKDLLEVFKAKETGTAFPTYRIHCGIYLYRATNSYRTAKPWRLFDANDVQVGTFKRLEDAMEFVQEEVSDQG